MVFYANSTRDPAIRLHCCAGVRLLVFAIEKAYKPVDDFCGRREQFSFAGFNRCSSHGFRSHGYLRA